MKNKLFVRRKTENYIEPVINDGEWPEEIQSILKPGMMIDPKSSCVWTIKGGCPKNLIARKGDLIVRDGEDIKGYENGQALLKDYKNDNPNFSSDFRKAITYLDMKKLY